MKFLIETDSLGMEDKRILFKHLSSNYGRTALCLSGGASFAYASLTHARLKVSNPYLDTITSASSRPISMLTFYPQPSPAPQAVH